MYLWQLRTKTPSAGSALSFAKKQDALLRNGCEKEGEAEEEKECNRLYVLF